MKRFETVSMESLILEITSNKRSGNTLLESYVNYLSKISVLYHKPMQSDLEANQKGKKRRVILNEQY